MTQNPTQRCPSLPPLHPLLLGPPPCAELGSQYLGQTPGPLHPWNLGGGGVMVRGALSPPCISPSVMGAGPGSQGQGLVLLLGGSRPLSLALCSSCRFWPSLWPRGSGRDAGCPRAPARPSLGPPRGPGHVTPTSATVAREALSLKEASSVASSGSRGCGRDLEDWCGWQGTEGGERKGAE